VKLAVLCALCAAMATPGYMSAGQGHSVTLDGVLRQLDRSAQGFRSLSANVERTTVTLVVNDHSTETGSLLVRGEKMLLQMNPPDSRTVLRNGDNFYIYTPGLKQVQEFNLGKNRDLADEFLLLGFGTTGTDLEKGFEIKLVGEETLDGKKDVELELTPKSAAVLKQFSKIQIWLDETSCLPDQQQFTENGSGDYVTVHYTKMVRNPNIPDSEFKPHWPKGTEKIKPQS
jgi:outer membrane lipoprotein-sorting protein